MSIKIETTEKNISVTSEYNPEFVAIARNLGGKWNSPAWVFDIRDEAEVREACMKFYGEDGLAKDQVDVKITFLQDDHSNRSSISIFGKVIAKAFGRDSGAKLGEGVSLKEGKFGSGGSVKNWETTVKKGTVVIVRDMSRAMAESASSDKFEVEIEILSSNASVDKEALKSERDRLVARIAEIDEQIAA